MRLKQILIQHKLLLLTLILSVLGLNLHASKPIQTSPFELKIKSTTNLNITKAFLKVDWLCDLEESDEEDERIERKLNSVNSNFRYRDFISKEVDPLNSNITYWSLKSRKKPAYILNCSLKIPFKNQ